MLQIHPLRRAHGRTSRLILAALAGVLSADFCRAGSVVTDGSVGARATLTGPTFNIPASLGQQKGANLFHSFSTFNLSSGETASFSGPTSVGNVIARVAGGQSSIDGTVQCSIPGANLYLINPAGVVFG
ncbi:MAG TPA: filamentous hemagglutinin N-terminal domain-containing protein, partial [Tepidisphaeraceae bacterium]|nr:filamentous hemagglutinin N-terminal domain-containing protein [Tepidisphaeraceae bacterium]